jgi:hypothetical protein
MIVEYIRVDRLGVLPGPIRGNHCRAWRGVYFRFCRSCAAMVRANDDEQPALSLLDVVVGLAGFRLDSSNFILIYAFQGGIIHQFSLLFPWSCPSLRETCS